MNKHYSYNGMDLWYEDSWLCKISPMNKIARFMAEKALYFDEGIARTEEEQKKISDGAYFDKRLKAYLPEEMYKYWEARNMRLVVNHAGEHWIALIPACVIDGTDVNPKTMMLIRETDYQNPFWAIDTIELYKKYFDMAAENGYMLVFTVMNKRDRSDLSIIILREVAQRYSVKYQNLYMDLEKLYEAGYTLKDVPELGYKGADGKITADPDKYTEKFHDGDFDALPIVDQWSSDVSLQLVNFYNGGVGTVPLDYDKLIYGHIGERHARAMSLEMDFDTDADAGVKERFDRMGIVAQYRETNKHGWVTVVPQSALDNPNEPLPCMCIMQEINPSCRHTVLSAYSMWYEYLEIAAQGDLMLLFFVLEEPEENDLLVDLIDEAKGYYPFLDRSRVYVTGHSHNGHYTMEFYKRHPDIIAGAGTMGNAIGLNAATGTVPMTDEDFEIMRKYDMPLININGDWENGYLGLIPGKALSDTAKVEQWQNRLRAFNCPMVDAETILAAKNSPSKATRMVGVPGDRSETVYFEGDECYMVDVKNNDGKVHLRLVTLENMPHGTTAHMPYLTWSFLRGFARDLETGKIIELL